MHNIWPPPLYKLQSETECFIFSETFVRALSADAAEFACKPEHVVIRRWRRANDLAANVDDTNCSTAAAVEANACPLQLLSLDQQKCLRFPPRRANAKQFLRFFRPSCVCSSPPRLRTGGLTFSTDVCREFMQEFKVFSRSLNLSECRRSSVCVPRVSHGASHMPTS